MPENASPVASGPWLVASVADQLLGFRAGVCSLVTEWRSLKDNVPVLPVGNYGFVES